MASLCAKAYWLNKELVLLIDGVLYRQRVSGDEKHLVLPASIKQEAIRLNHDLPSAGHRGVALTKARVKEKFRWYKMNQDIASYVSNCASCNQQKKADMYGHVPVQEYQAGAPMERVHLDFLGPLPLTARKPICSDDGRPVYEVGGVYAIANSDSGIHSQGCC